MQRDQMLDGCQPSRLSEIHELMFVFLGENTTRKVG